MPPSIELNIGHVPSPGRRGSSREEDDAAPFRILVVGDFSGHAAVERPPLKARRPVRVDIDKLDAVFARFAPSAEIAGMQNRAGAPLRIVLEGLDDLSADAVLARLPAEAMARLAASAEIWLKRPVVAINTAIYWNALRSSGITDRVPGFGTLLERH